jgi:cation diffusion facilitator family transporter
MTEFLSKIFIKNYQDTSNDKVRSAYGTLSSIVGILVNVIIASAKLIIGILTFSSAIIADAINNYSDAASSIVTLVSFKLSSKPADKDHPFGHARIEYVSSMIVSFLILLVGFETVSDAISSIIGIKETTAIKFSTISIIILAISIIFKLWLGLFYRKIGKKINSATLIASSADSLTDSVSTLAALISSIIIKFTGLDIIDSIVAVGISIMIFIAGLKILNDTKNSILGEAPLKEQVDSIEKMISEYPEILGIHDLLVHNYGPNHYIASLHAEVDGNHDIYMLHDLIDNVEKRIQDDLNILCTIHMDPIVTDDETVNELKSFLLKTINDEISESISIHDFRVVVGNTHTNLIFDVVLPFESKYSPEEIIELICEKIKEKKENCYCVITVDRG